MSRATSWIARACLVALVAQALVGAVWLARNTGKVPHYGDTREMLDTAGTLRFVTGRTIAYPWFLRAVKLASGGEGWGADVRWETNAPDGPVECESPPWQAWVQVLQVAALFGALLHALAVFLPRPFAGRRIRLAALAAFVALDPWVLHQEVSLMTDALAMAGLLVFAASFTSFVVHGRRRALPLLFAAAVAAGTLRPEKGPLVVAAALAAAALFSVVRRFEARGAGDPDDARRSLRRRAWGAVLVVLLALAAALGLDRLRDEVETPFGGTDTVLLTRVVFPHLTESYDRLSPGTREVISRLDAAQFDLSAQDPRRVLRRRTGEDPARIAELTRDMVRAVWPEHAADIALDVGRDLTRYTFTTVTFYARLVAWWRFGFSRDVIRFRSYEGLATCLSYVGHEPGWSVALAVVAAAATGLGLLVLLAAVAAGARDRATRRRVASDPVWVLPVLLVLGNAAAFALTNDLFDIRYGLPSHVLALLVAYGAVLRRAAPPALER